jgi:hypothetical protein
MKHFKIDIDLTDIYLKLSEYKLRQYTIPFFTYFIEAEDPDDACYESILRMINLILERDDSISTRIFCRTIKKYIRFDKIRSL